MLDKALILKKVGDSKPGLAAYAARHVEESNKVGNPFELHRVQLSTHAIIEFPGSVEAYFPSAGRLNVIRVFVDATAAIARDKKVPEALTNDEFLRIEKEIVKAIKPYNTIQTNQLVTRLEFSQVPNFHTTNRLTATLEFRGA